MKVGDLVKQSDKILKFRGKNAPARSNILGTVISIRDEVFPEHWEESETRNQLAKMLGRRVDVMWSTGRLSEGFAENSLEVVYIV